MTYNITGIAHKHHTDISPLLNPNSTPNPNSANVNASFDARFPVLPGPISGPGGLPGSGRYGLPGVGASGVAGGIGLGRDSSMVADDFSIQNEDFPGTR